MKAFGPLPPPPYRPSTPGIFPRTPAKTGYGKVSPCQSVTGPLRPAAVRTGRPRTPQSPSRCPGGNGIIDVVVLVDIPVLRQLFGAENKYGFIPVFVNVMK